MSSEDDSVDRTSEPGADGGRPEADSDRPARRLRELGAKRPLLLAVTMFAAGAVVAGAIAAAVVASKNSDIERLQADLAAQTQARETAESERDDAIARAARITDRRDEIVAGAKSKAEDMIDDAKQELSGLEDKIDSARSDLAATESKLEDVQDSLDVAQEQKQMSSFGNGTWQADVDYLPGTYEAPGGGGCYWEKLNGPSGGGINNIIDNGGFGRHQIVSVDSPYFHTEDCGTWTRVGE